MIWSLAIWPVLAGLAIWAAGDGARRRLGGAAATAMLLTLALALLAQGWTGRYAWSGTIVLQAGLTPFAQAVAITVPAVALAVVVFAAAHEAERGLARLLGLLVVFVGGMELIVIASDLATLLIGWEIVGACSWALIGHAWRGDGNVRSANYAFVVTRAGDLGLFLALFATFAGAGSLDYAALGRLEGAPLVVAAFGILLAAASKAGQVPFSPWLFRAMDGPTSVSALLHSAAMVAAGAYLVARLQPQLARVPGFGACAIDIGLLTALAGGLVAVRQTHAKKLLAGSTSAQLGLMFAASGAGFPGAAVLHLIAHAAFKAPLFFAAGIAHGETGTYDLRAMRLGRALPWIAGLTAVAALALAGVPPLGGAWSKEEIVKALGEADPWVAFAAMAVGGLSAAYATRFAVMAFAPGQGTEPARRSPGAFAALAALALASVALGAVWLPPVHEAAARFLGVELPTGTALEGAVSLALVALGVLAGLWLVRHPGRAPASDWLGLSAAIGRLVVRPFEAAARGAARFDDVVLDAIPRGAAHTARAASGWSGRADDTGIDGLRPCLLDRARRGVAEAGGRGAVALVVRATDAVARLAGTPGEAATDMIPGGAGRLAGMAGGDVRRLQTGMSHHYYVILIAGIVAALAILFLGA